MKNAIVGDDVFGEDPTINALEKRVASIFKKEAALFFPSGTMSNLTALLTWCSSRGSEVILGDNSHMFLFEQSGASQFGGISPRTVPNLSDGTMDINSIRLAIRDNDIHEPISKLICIENTHNACGGKILPIAFLEELYNLSRKYSIPIHLDGARIWNALTSMNIEPSNISKYVDSLSVCLSKGLGAPAGSLLVGSSEFIVKARRIRKALGGGMRQVGILGAAGMKALDDFENGILVKDHLFTQHLIDNIKILKSFRVHKNVQTNIIFIDIILYDKSWNKEEISSNISKILKSKNVLVSAWAPLLLRLVIHRDITYTDIQYTINALSEISEYLSNL